MFCFFIVILVFFGVVSFYSLVFLLWLYRFFLHVGKSGRVEVFFLERGFFFNVFFIVV